MNRLLIDQGNSRTKLAWRTAGGIDLAGSGENLAALLDGLERTPDGIWLASVADSAARAALEALLGQRFGCVVEHASVARHQLHQPTRYAGEQLGVDRWLALLAAREVAEGPLVVVDVGTATTVDLLDADGLHLGGYILPGFASMRCALLDATAIKVPDSPARQQRPPRDTVSAIAQAGPAAVAALVGQLREEMSGGAGGQAGLVLGGGAAAELAPLLEPPLWTIEQLVLSGLAVLSRLEEEKCAG